MFTKLLTYLVFTIIIISCAKKEFTYKTSEEVDPYVVYEEGYAAFQINDFFFANKKFTEAESSFEDINLAAKASIMSCFSLYAINFYDEALEKLETFKKNYPSDVHIIYAEYLKAIIFFEQMSDEKKDVKPLLDAQKQIKYIIKKYPDSDYSIDLEFKKNLIENQLAAKEMFIAKYYISVQKWIPAINRLKFIIKQYDETIFVEEALHRLVEIHYYLGLENEAKKYASILGYNYNSSEWFDQTYKIVNKNYKIEIKNKKETKKEKESLIKKIIKKIK